MANYKGIPFPDQVAPLVRYMDSLNDHRETLATLSGTWDTLSLLGHLSNLNADMGDVRQAFVDLTGELLSCLAEETLAHARGALNNQAQIAVDVLTRNLFERTADIGFLATDSVIVSACASGDESTLRELRQRFLSYVSKYTVYKDIILMRVDGQVMARMKDGFVGCSSSDIIARAKSTASAYIETYAPTDFCGNEWALTYAYRVESNHQTIGILALEFDVRAEVRTILSDIRDKNVMVAFLGADGRVLLSSDRVALPTGYLLPLKKGSVSMRLGGVSYLAAQRSPQPYQGYGGPGWTAVALLLAEIAFEDGGSPSTAVNFTGENVFSPRLLSIPDQARQIQTRLDRLVWNGRVQQADVSNTFSRALLEEIAATGRKTKDVFERSSSELLAMVASSLLSETQFLAGLSVDILDRNLYERANDCRWWAASPALTTFDADTCRTTLSYINALYTVYSNVFVIDSRGVVIAASQDTHIEGQTLSEPWVTQCLSTRDPMGYAVSSFEATALYANQRTYIYSAPIFKDGFVVGAVGLVFDSTPQFLAMLTSALPSTDGAIAAFCLPNGTLISQTANLPLALPSAVLNLGPGQSWSGVLNHGEKCYSVGATAGRGYREFKTSDGYSEHVIAVVVVPCGNSLAKPCKPPARLVHENGGTEIATFFVGEQLMGIVAKEVIECIDVAKAVNVSGIALVKRHVGFTTRGNKALPLLDLTEELNEMNRSMGQRHALVLRNGETEYGLLVSHLGPVLNMHVYGTQRMPGTGGSLRWYSQVARSGDALVPILTVDQLLTSPE